MDFLLVRHSTVSEILQVFVLTTHPYSALILGVFPLEEIAHVGVCLDCPSMNLKLISREIMFKVFQPMIPVPERHRHTVV